MRGVNMQASHRELLEMSSSVPRKKSTAQGRLTKITAKEHSTCFGEFLAPYTKQSKHAIVKVDGTNYRFRIVGFQGSGFGIFQPIDPTCAKFVRAAESEQVYDYLRIFPKMHVILVCQTNLGWCAYPLNIESTKAKFDVDFEIIIRNVSDAERFDVAVVRCDGRNFWYEELFTGSDPIKSEFLRECFELRTEPLKIQKELSKINGVTLEERKSLDLALASWRQFRRQNTDAESDNYVICGKQIEMQWQAHSGNAEKDIFSVVSSGICLTNNKFHLNDLPGAE